MNKNIFQGELVRLTAEDPEIASKAFAQWGRDSEYLRLLDSNGAVLWSAKKIKEWIEKDLEKSRSDECFFFIRTLDGDHPIGIIGLGGIRWDHGDAWVGIGIGERECWGKGYGTDAMRIMLRYAFTELNLHRLTLGAFAYNPRAIRSYEKAGFVHEGLERLAIQRDGARANVVIMGILRTEWEKLYDPSPISR